MLFPESKKGPPPPPRAPLQAPGAPQPRLLASSAAERARPAGKPQPPLTRSESTFELSPLFQESGDPQGVCWASNPPGTCYLGQQAKGNHETSADKATMRPACCNQGKTCSQIIAGLAACPPQAPKPKSLSLLPSHPPTPDIPLLLDNWQFWLASRLAPGSPKPALNIVEYLVPPGSSWCKQAVSHWDLIPGLFVQGHLRDISDFCAALETTMYV